MAPAPIDGSSIVFLTAEEVAGYVSSKVSTYFPKVKFSPDVIGYQPEDIPVGAIAVAVFANPTDALTAFERIDKST